MNIEEVMNTEEAIITLKEEASYQLEAFGESEIPPVIDFIESQQKTIEDMKCCGNCKHTQNISDFCKAPNSWKTGCFYKTGNVKHPKLWELEQ